MIKFNVYTVKCDQIIETAYKSGKFYPRKGGLQYDFPTRRERDEQVEKLRNTPLRENIRTEESVFEAQSWNHFEWNRAGMRCDEVGLPYQLNELELI